jgi:hypothetical protein
MIHFTPPSRLTTNLLIKAIDRKFAGVMSVSGILTSNSASIVRTKLTMSSELRPAWRRSSSDPTDRVIERSESIRWTTAETLSCAPTLGRSNIITTPQF